MTTNSNKVANLVKLIGLITIYGGLEEAEHPAIARTRAIEVVETAMEEILLLHKEHPQELELLQNTGGQMIRDFVSLTKELAAE